MKQNFGTSVWMVCTTCTIIAIFGYYRSQIIVVAEREYSKPAENDQTLITNRLQETLFLTQNTKNDEKIKIFGKASLLTLTNDLFYSLTFLTPSLHHPASLYKEGSICNEEMLRFSFRMEVQPGGHRLADLWPFASKSKTRLLFAVHVSNME